MVGGEAAILASGTLNSASAHAAADRASWHGACNMVGTSDSSYTGGMAPMTPQEHTNNIIGRPTTLGTNFSADEIAKLVDLRHSVHEHTEFLARVIDQRRLEFARWLLEQGKISEAEPGR
jgi:hypothetical protein